MMNAKGYPLVPGMEVQLYVMAHGCLAKGVPVI